ncbi:hypothetical protein [Hydrogenophaga sp. 2FB]|uniref:hypothetical protein n=1 Tax=Hydrogenophaga sp. 2FB TaxID=2502187 RepID=UPI0010F6BC57|nr:hypothetical protein [Hydrogenophaga sp. 2FB]
MKTTNSSFSRGPSDRLARAGQRGAYKPETLIRASNEATLALLKSPLRTRDAANTMEGSLPEGYKIIDADGYVIGLRDLVFVGGSKPTWVPARRAGEAGEMIRFSTARAVACLSRR